MSPKVRIDLMVNDTTKQFLQGFAQERGVSMSEMVDQLIVEHLMNESGHGAQDALPSDATFDILRITGLQKRVEEAIASGRVWSFTRYCGLVESDPGASMAGSIVYEPSKWREYAVIVEDCVPYAGHRDVLTTYGGDKHPSVLDTVDVYLAWCDYDDGYHVDGLCIVPKGGDPTGTDCYDWTAEVQWPDDVDEPQPGGD